MICHGMAWMSWRHVHTCRGEDSINLEVHHEPCKQAADGDERGIATKSKIGSRIKNWWLTYGFGVAATVRHDDDDEQQRDQDETRRNKDSSLVWCAPYCTVYTAKVRSTVVTGSQSTDGSDRRERKRDQITGSWVLGLGSWGERFRQFGIWGLGSELDSFGPLNPGLVLSPKKQRRFAGCRARAWQLHPEGSERGAKRSERGELNGHGCRRKVSI